MDSTKWCWTILQTPICHCVGCGPVQGLMETVLYLMPVAERSLCTEWLRPGKALMLCSTSQLNACASGSVGIAVLNFSIPSMKCFVPGPSVPQISWQNKPRPWNIITGWESSICVSGDFAIRKRSGALWLSQIYWEEGKHHLPLPKFQPLLNFPSCCLPYLFWDCTEGHLCLMKSWEQGHRVVTKGGWL